MPNIKPKQGLLKHTHIVTKRNILNEFYPGGLSLQELRFFVIYLSKINPKDESSRVVRFPLEDYQAIMGLGSRPSVAFLKKSVEGLLNKIKSIDLPNGGFDMFHLFKRAKLDQDEYGEWYVEINASDEALPLFFDVHDKYFKYQLWNTLRLKSINQLRMYELLKQYEKIGYRIISVTELKKQLGIDENDYARFSSFKQDVLDICQNALTHYTDISFTYEPYGKKGRGGKVVYLKFTITSNKEFEDPLSLEMFIEKTRLMTADTDNIVIEDENAIESEYSDSFNERIEFLMEACNNEFSFDEMMIINNWLGDNKPNTFMNKLNCYNFLHGKFLEMMRYDKRGDGIKHKFKYFQKILDGELQN